MYTIVIHMERASNSSSAETLDDSEESSDSEGEGVYEAMAVSGEQKRPVVIQQSHNPRANVAGAQAYGVPPAAAAGAAAAAPDVHDGDSTLLAPPSPERRQQQQLQGMKGNQSPALLVDLAASPVSLRRGLPSDNIPNWRSSHEVSAYL